MAENDSLDRKYNLVELARLFGVEEASLTPYQISAEMYNPNPEFVLSRAGELTDKTRIRTAVGSLNETFQRETVLGEIILPKSFIDKASTEEVYLEDLFTLDEESDRKYRATQKQRPMSHTLYFRSNEPTFLVSCNPQLENAVQSGTWSDRTLFTCGPQAGFFASKYGRIRVADEVINPRIRALIEAEYSRAAQVHLIAGALKMGLMR